MDKSSDESSDKSSDGLSEQQAILNRSRYIVGNHVITELDLQRTKRLLQQQGIGRNLDKRARDLLIERQLLKIAIEEASIIITEERVEDEVRARRTSSGLSPQRFQQQVERETGLPYDEWVAELYYEIARRYFMQISLNVAAASEKEVRRFYNRNRRKLGVEIRYREIILTPKNRSVKEEARISKLASRIYGQLQNAPESFARVARATPQNSSRSRRTGGLRPYRPIQEIAAEDRVVANLLFQEKSGKVLRPFRDVRNRYRIIKIEGRRYLPYQKVKPFIQRKLYVEKLEKAFQVWVAKKSKEVSIIHIP